MVGAGIVGLAHAAAALAQGARVAVVERDSRAVGASVRNFGHGCVTGQSGTALDYAMAARLEWLRLAKLAGFWIRDAGTVVVARAEDEYAVLEDLRAERGEDVVLLDAAAVRSRIPVGDGVIGGAWLPLDLRVDAREAPAAIASWLAAQGVRFHWSTTVHSIDRDEVRTSRGTLKAGKVVVAVGHNVDRLFPQIAADAGVRRCSLHMLSLTGVTPREIDPAVLTGWSLLRYDGFSASPAAAQVRDRLRAEDPTGHAANINIMFTQRPDGDIVFGDTHAYDTTTDPFQDAAFDDVLLSHARTLFGTDAFRVRARWQGVYASAPTPFLVSSPTPDLRVVSVTSGIGMTTGFGLGLDVVAGLL